MFLQEKTLEYIRQHGEEAFRLLVELAKIPAPSNHEEKRAVFCKDWLERQGAGGVYIDGALNTVYPVNCGGNGPIVVFMAHSDIVFPDTGELPLTVADGRVYCPGAGDDTANAVALLMTVKYVIENRLAPENCGVLFAVNSGEEGLGNLKGSRRIIQDYGSRVSAVFSFDGGNAKIVNGAVGSRRYRVEILTEGGHSYGKFGNRNAIAYLASMIDTLYTVKVPEGGKTTYNVGTISGGTSVNSIAQQAEMLYEFRSGERASLDFMENHLNAAAAFYRSKGVRVNVELVGERPCMGDVDPLEQQALADKAAAAVRRHFGKEPVFESGSTDCNIPLAAGIPAIAVGCYNGGGAHTREEYVEIDSLLQGLRLCSDLVLGYFAE